MTTLAASSVQIRSSFVTGVLFALGYVVFSAAKGVYVGHLVQGIHPMAVSFACFSIAALFFNFTQSQVHTSGRSRRYWKEILRVNLTTLGAWLVFYYALKVLEPAVTSCIVMGVGPAATVFLQRGRELRLLERWSALGVLVAICFLAAISVEGASAVQSSGAYTVLGLLAALVSGISAASNTIASKELYKNGFQPNEVMAIRFYLLLIVSGLILLGARPPIEALLVQWPGVVLISVFGLMLPLACLQFATQRLDAMVVAFASALLPVFMLPLQSLDSRLVASLPSALGVLATVAFIALGVYARAPGSAQKASS